MKDSIYYVAYVAEFIARASGPYIARTLGAPLAALDEMTVTNADTMSSVLAGEMSKEWLAPTIEANKQYVRDQLKRDPKGRDAMWFKIRAGTDDDGDEWEPGFGL